MLHFEKWYNNRTLLFVKGIDALPVETTKKKQNRRGRWGLKDLIFGLFGLVAIGAITLAAFLAVKWGIARYAHLLPWGH